ncbi:Hypothetical protein EMIHUDRAFT_196514 [Emiliania huxleyi CCMP1516]|uniref:J domain-containing protein n=2 Tax=Emiliania huxleyi TaxID=2903 RepID=A0A0D3J487_EMIH1|nr:Hypothetical protein EMIHUDRAFT_196514 [Emiliania huxleyi CCMP1516]EOD18322.1 Hypothetical protein EMIHUDRAFT_196514 [Emiliania huxleyi CCMP1516]|eukprot:XP_005770751.1 Hypothetical protein EMIHUDRAFT_196514 [Emiliania huxleyi CCMP1516]
MTRRARVQSWPGRTLRGTLFLGYRAQGQASAAPAGPGATLRSRSSTMIMAEGDDPAEVLGVRPGASPAELKAAYRERAKQWHPDLNPTKYAAQKFRLLTEASLPLHCRPAFRRSQWGAQAEWDGKRVWPSSNIAVPNGAPDKAAKANEWSARTKDFLSSTRRDGDSPAATDGQAKAAGTRKAKAATAKAKAEQDEAAASLSKAERSTPAADPKSIYTVQGASTEATRLGRQTGAAETAAAETPSKADSAPKEAGRKEAPRVVDRQRQSIFDFWTSKDEAGQEASGPVAAQVEADVAETEHKQRAARAPANGTVSDAEEAAVVAEGVGGAEGELEALRRQLADSVAAGEAAMAAALKAAAEEREAALAEHEAAVTVAVGQAIRAEEMVRARLIAGEAGATAEAAAAGDARRVSPFTVDTATLREAFSAARTTAGATSSSFKPSFRGRAGRELRGVQFKQEMPDRYRDYYSPPQLKGPPAEKQTAEAIQKAFNYQRGEYDRVRAAAPATVASGREFHP